MRQPVRDEGEEGDQVELDWQGIIPPETREKLLGRKTPDLVIRSKERPPIRNGDHVVLQWGEGHDPELARKALPSRYSYAKRWITVHKVTLAEPGVWVVIYSPPEPLTMYMRRGGGLTGDRIRSIDPEAPYLRIHAEGENEVTQERRRLETSLVMNRRRHRTATNPETRQKAAERIARLSERLAVLDAQKDRAA